MSWVDELIAMAGTEEGRKKLQGLTGAATASASTGGTSKASTVAGGKPLAGSTTTSSAITDPTGSAKAGRPANGSGDISSKLKKILKPEYPALRDEAAKEHPILALDEQTQNMLTVAGKTATNMAAGILDPETTKQISKISAEKALKGGLGIGQAARNLTVRDLGLTQLDVQTKGVELATNLGNLQMDFANKKASFLKDMRQLDLGAAELRMKSLQLDREEDRARWDMIGKAIGDYHNKVYQFRMTRGDAQGSIDDASEDYVGMLTDMRKKWGMK
jgi:hypothetical protein